MDDKSLIKKYFQGTLGPEEQEAFHERQKHAHFREAIAHFERYGFPATPQPYFDELASRNMEKLLSKKRRRRKSWNRQMYLMISLGVLLLASAVFGGYQIRHRKQLQSRNQELQQKVHMLEAKKEAPFSVKGAEDTLRTLKAHRRKLQKSLKQLRQKQQEVEQAKNRLAHTNTLLQDSLVAMEKQIARQKSRITSLRSEQPLANNLRGQDDNVVYPVDGQVYEYGAPIVLSWTTDNPVTISLYGDNGVDTFITPENPYTYVLKQTLKPGTYHWSLNGISRSFVVEK